VKQIVENNDLPIVEAYLGKNIILRTVTMHHIGKLVACDNHFLKLEPAVWLADSDRWNNALLTGQVDEVEPFPAEVLVSRGALVDVAPWDHSVPKEAK